MKKYISLLLISVMLLALCSCYMFRLSFDDPAANDPAVNDPTVDDPIVDDPVVDDPVVDPPHINTEPPIIPPTGEPVEIIPLEGYGAWGNSYLNYNRTFICFAQHGDRVFLTDLGDSFLNLSYPNCILDYNLVTGEKSYINEWGMCLGIYNDILFFHDLSFSKICKYDLNTRELTCISSDDILTASGLKDSIQDAHTPEFSDLIVGQYGMIFNFSVCTAEDSLGFLFHTDFYGNILSITPLETNESLNSIVPVSDDKAVWFSTKLSYVLLYDLSKHEITRYDTEFPLQRLITNGDGIIYYTGTEYNLLHRYDSSKQEHRVIELDSDKKNISTISLTADGIVCAKYTSELPDLAHTEYLSFNDMMFHNIFSSYSLSIIAFSSCGDMIAALYPVYEPESTYENYLCVTLSPSFLIKEVLSMF